VRDRAALRGAAVKVTARCPSCAARIALLWPHSNVLGPSWDGNVFGRCVRDPRSPGWPTWSCKRKGCPWEKRLDDRHVARQIRHAIATGAESFILGAAVPPRDPSRAW
jgi:hypothetical protein